MKAKTSDRLNHSTTRGRRWRDPSPASFDLRGVIFSVLGYVFYRLLLSVPFLIGTCLFSENWKILLTGLTGWLLIWLVFTHLKTK